jgi:diaminopimelate epimerase
MKFWKLEAIGNDFPLIHLAEVAAEALPDLAVKMSDRRFGIGGDGLLAVGMEEGDLRLRMFNPDGTEDFCGNGMRCAALHALDQGWVSNVFAIRHLDRHVPTSITKGMICTTLGQISYNPADVPVTTMLIDAELPGFENLGTVSATTTGSTHLVIHRLPESDEEFFDVSPRLEVAPFFPERTSVIWTGVEAPGVLKLRIWERGVGETQGCGTGSSAAAADYLRRSGYDGLVRVLNPGGEVRVGVPKWDVDITICGTARQVYVGDFK